MNELNRTGINPPSYSSETKEPLYLDEKGKKILVLANGVFKLLTGIFINAGIGGASGGSLMPLIMLCGGTGLVSSGLGDIAYALKTPEKITCERFVKQSAISFIAGAAGGGAGIGLNAFVGPSVNSLVLLPLVGAVSSTASNTASTFTEAVIKQDPKVLERLTSEKLIQTVALGAITGVMANATSNIVKEGGQLLLNSSSVNPITKTFIEATTGAASGSVVKMTQNLFNQYTFLKIVESEPEEALIERDTLYVYVKEHAICFLSVNAEGRSLKTYIRQQDEFQINHDQETSFEKLISGLKPKREKELSHQQKEFILKSALQHGHAPVCLLNGVMDAAAIGAVIGLIQAVADRWKTEISQTNESVQATKTTLQDDKGKRIPLKRRFEHLTKTLQEDDQEVHLQQISEENSHLSNRYQENGEEAADEIREFSIQKKQKIEKEPCRPVEVSPQQIEAAQAYVNKASQKYTNLVALSRYTVVDIENEATRIYNDAKNSGYYGSSQAIPYIERKLSDEYGVPMGTITTMLETAYKRTDPDKKVPMPIRYALTEQRNKGFALSQAKENWDQATQRLKNLQEPSCAASEMATLPPTFIQAPDNILELVTNSENLARNQGQENNINVQMRELTIALVGIDHGELYDHVYGIYLEASFKWKADRNQNKPTQYGFLTRVTDLLVNGTSTVPVEVKEEPWYKKALKYVGRKGVQVQTNGSNIQIRPLEHPHKVKRA